MGKPWVFATMRLFVAKAFFASRCQHASKRGRFVRMKEFFCLTPVVKGALSRYSVLLRRCFCGRKWRPGDPRPRRRPTSYRHGAHFFVLQAGSFAIDQRRSISRLPKSFLSRTKSTSGFKNWSRKGERKDELAQWRTWTMEKCTETKAGLQAAVSR